MTGLSRPGGVLSVCPRVSVVTPSFNQARFLERTIRSVLDQDYPNLEYVVIDGGSSDGSVDIIRKYASRLASWVTEPDEGQAHAITKGFKRASGEILAYLNSDDYYLPGAISTAVASFRQEVDLVYGDVVIVDEQDGRIGERRLTPMDCYDFLGLGNCLAQPATFWTRRIYDAVGGINPSYYFQMDLEFFIRVAVAGRIGHIRTPLAAIRLHPKAKTSTAEHVRLAELRQIRQHYVTAHGVGRWRYTKPWLLGRHIVRLALQGDTAYVGQKLLRKLWPRAVRPALSTGQQEFVHGVGAS